MKRCTACWLLVGLLALVVASFVSLDLQWSRFFSADALRRMKRRNPRIQDAYFCITRVFYAGQQPQYSLRHHAVLYIVPRAKRMTPCTTASDVAFA